MLPPAGVKLGASSSTVCAVSADACTAVVAMEGEAEEEAAAAVASAAFHLRIPSHQSFASAASTPHAGVPWGWFESRLKTSISRTPAADSAARRASTSLALAVRFESALSAAYAPHDRKSGQFHNKMLLSDSLCHHSTVLAHSGQMEVSETVFLVCFAWGA